MRSTKIYLFVCIVAFSNLMFSQSYWSWGNITDLDALGKYEFHLNKVKTINLITTQKYKDHNTINSYKKISNLDTLGNVLTEIITEPDSDSILFSKKFIYDENFNLIKIFRGDLLSVEFDYDDSNRVNKHTTYKYDGSILHEMYFDYINKHNDKLRDLLLHKYDGRIDTVFTHDYTYIFYNFNPIRLRVYYKNYLTDIYQYDVKGRITIKTGFRDNGDTVDYKRTSYDDDNKTQLSEIYNSIA